VKESWRGFSLRAPAYEALKNGFKSLMNSDPASSSVKNLVNSGDAGRGAVTAATHTLPALQKLTEDAMSAYAHDQLGGFGMQRVGLGSTGHGFDPTFQLNYSAGSSAHKYETVSEGGIQAGHMSVQAQKLALMDGTTYLICSVNLSKPI